MGFPQRGGAGPGQGKPRESAQGTSPDSCASRQGRMREKANRDQAAFPFRDCDIHLQTSFLEAYL